MGARKKTKRIINKRPLAAIAVFFALGVVLGRYIHWQAAYIIATVVLAAAAACLRKRGALTLVCGAALCFAAFLSASVFASGDADTGDDMRVTGRVCAQPYENGYGNTILLLDNTAIGGVSCGGIKLYVDGDVAAVYAPGDVVAATADVEVPNGVRNPGGFDEKLYLLSQGIRYKAYAETADITGTRGGIAVALAEARIRIGETVAAIFPDDVAPVAVAMILGDKQGLDEETYTAFRDTGTAHVLAVSGLHASILIGAVYFVLKRLRAGRTPRYIITVCFIAAYALLTGLSPSIVRASIMAAVLLTGRYAGRQTDTLSHLALAFILALVINPADLFSAGFQLSFGAVFGILTIGWQVEHWLKQRLPEKGACLAGAIGISVGATAGTLPVIAMTFNRISVLGFLTNIVLIPFASMAIVLVFIAVLFGLVWAPIALPFAVVVGTLIRGILLAIKALASLPFAAVNIASPPIWLALGWFVLLFIGSKYLLVRKKTRALLAAAMCAAAVVVVLATQSHGMYVAFLDVGQADAAFIRTAQGGEYFIDGGRERSADEVVDFTIRNGYTPDAAFVSHSDADHFSGIVALYDAGLLSRAYCSWQEMETVQAAMPDADVVPLCAGDTVLLDESTQALVLYPYKDTDGEERNDNSLVVLVTYEDHSVLFAGDISGAVETSIFAGMDEVDIYKAAHHGSKYSSYQLPLSVLSPEYSIVSVGYNTFGHPHPWAMKNLEMYSDAVYTTQDDGAVVFYIDDEVVVKTYGE